tara:strand:- start:16022 stop:17143 length:1122 start_codon:yes stop_codon:yes gene_type:complete
MIENKVLITGGAGFIGSHTADNLINSGYDVTILDVLHPKTHNENWPKYLHPKIKKVRGSVKDRELLSRLLQDTNYVIHLAAEMDLNPDFEKFMDINVGSTALIYELIVKNNLNIKKVIIASSQFVYGEGKWKCPTHGNFYPNSRNKQSLKNGKWDHLCPKCGKKATYNLNVESYQNPPNHYALSKYFQELTGLQLGRLYEIPSVALRYSIVHGPRQSLKNTYSGALRIFSLNLLLDRDLASFEDNSSLRDYISVYDVAEANRIVMENELANYQVFNVCGDRAYKVSELAQIVSDKLNKKYRFSKNVEFRVGDIRHAVSSNKKLKELGWKINHSEENVVEEYVEWLVSQKIDFKSFINSQKKIRELGIVENINN